MGGVDEGDVAAELSPLLVAPSFPEQQLFIAVVWALLVFCRRAQWCPFAAVLILLLFGGTYPGASVGSIARAVRLYARA